MEKLRRESAERKKEQAKSDNAVPRIATAIDKSISQRSDWEHGTDGSDTPNNRHLGKTLVHEHATESSSEVRVPSGFEIRCDGNPRDPRERSGGRKLRKAK